MTVNDSKPDANANAIGAKKTTNRTLESVATFAERYPFTEPQVRWWIQSANENGLAALRGVVRIGRRVYIDVDAFDRWIEQQNRQAHAA